MYFCTCGKLRIEPSYPLSTLFYRSSWLMKKEQYKIEEIVSSKRRVGKYDKQTNIFY